MSPASSSGSMPARSEVGQAPARLSLPRMGTAHGFCDRADSSWDCPHDDDAQIIGLRNVLRRFCAEASNTPKLLG